ncbi:MAG: sugar phosphate isomerase/epimerase [Pseudomonadota bacterium]
MDLSFQLYSARNFLPWDGVVSRLAELGYSQVEGFGGVFGDPDGFAALLAGAGLTMPTAHFSVTAMETDFDASIALAHTLGVKAIFCPYLDADQRPGDVAGWRAFAKRLAAIGEKVKGAELAFGWHNHDFEFQALAGGDQPQTIILEEAPDIDWEADIAWIVRGGDDPLSWIDRYGSRITAVHVKDIAPAGECVDEDGWEDVGHGTMDWRQILRQLHSKSAVRYLVMEHDNPSDFNRFAGRSIEAVRSMEETQNA